MINTTEKEASIDHTNETSPIWESNNQDREKAKLVQKESSNRLIGVDDIKKKFQSEIDEYLKKAKKGL